MKGFEIAAVEDAALEGGMLVRLGMGEDGGAYFAAYVKVWDDQVVIFGWCGVAHVFLHEFPFLLPVTGASIRHWEDAEVVFGEEEDVKSVKEHGEGDPFEDPY